MKLSQKVGAVLAISGAAIFTAGFTAIVGVVVVEAVPAAIHGDWKAAAFLGAVVTAAAFFAGIYLVRDI